MMNRYLETNEWKKDARAVQEEIYVEIVNVRNKGKQFAETNTCLQGDVGAVCLYLLARSRNVGAPIGLGYKAPNFNFNITSGSLPLQLPLSSTLGSVRRLIQFDPTLGFDSLSRFIWHWIASNARLLF